MVAVVAVAAAAAATAAAVAGSRQQAAGSFQQARGSRQQAAVTATGCVTLSSMFAVLAPHKHVTRRAVWINAFPAKWRTARVKFLH